MERSFALHMGTSAVIRSILLGSLFALAAPAPADAPAAAQRQAPAQDQERFVLLEGGRNFRDAGGYQTADGRRVKRGVLYRSGSLGSLTPAGQAALARLHIASEIDLRTTEERSRDSLDLRTMIGPGYWTRDYGMSLGNTRSVFPDPSRLTVESVRTMMSEAYKSLPREQAPSYRELFARLQTDTGPLVVNCTAGKDRTGIATALVLTALGVPYETVRQDFLLSNGAPGMDTLQASLSSPMAKLPPEVAGPLIGVEGSYLDTAFAQVRQDYGSIENYMQQALGVGPAEIARLKARMLEN
jgi:protein-tyrosine phosphatase